MRILVTGGAGFIGSHIVDRLVETGHAVSVVDNLSTGRIENLNSAAKFHNIDIRSNDLQAVFDAERPDIVSHHAAQIDVRRSVEDPLFDSEVNVQGTVNVLECCRKNGVKKIVFASSGGAIYGEPENLPVDEDHPVKPEAPYGLAKSVGEQYLDLYQRLFGISCISLRYGNVYGLRQDPSGEAGVVAIFIDRLLKGEQPVIYGDGEQTRDYVFIGDIVEANIAALETSVSGVYNIGTGVGTSVNDLYELITGTFDVDMFPDYKPARHGEINHIALDSAKANKVLGWSPVMNLADGIRRTIDGWRKVEELVT